MMRRIIFILVIYAIAESLWTKEYTPIIIDKNFTETAVNDPISYYPDISETKNISEIVQLDESSWKLLKGGIASFGRTPFPHWIRFQLNVQPENQGNFFILVEFAVLDTVELYYSKDGKEFLKAEPNLKNSASSNHEFSLQNIPKGMLHVYLKLTSIKSSLLAPIKVLKESFYIIKNERMLLINGFYFGLIFVLISYFIFVYFSLREKVYLFYGGYNIGFLFIYLNLSGYGSKYLWSFLDYDNIFRFILTSAFVILPVFVIFTILFVQTSMSLKKHLPVLDRIFNVSIFITLALSLAGLTMRSSDMYPILLSIMNMIAFIFLLFGIVLLSIYYMYKKYDISIFFILAWIIMSIGISLRFLLIYGLVPLNLVTQHGYQISHALQLVLVGIGLSSRIREVRREKETYQKINDLTLEQLKSANDKLNEYSENLENRVTERTKDLEESEKRYKMLFEYSPDAIAIHANGVVINVNDFCVRLFGGHSKDEMIGQPISRFIHPDYAHTVKDRLKSLATGEVKFLPILEEKFLRLDGSPMDVEVTTSLIHHEGKSAFQTVIRDTSERKKWERALVESESKLARASQLAHVGHWEWDMITNKFSWTDEVYHIFGYQPGEFEPTYEKIMEIIHVDDREKLETAIKDSVENCTPFNVQYRYIKPDGALAYGHVIGNVEFDSAGKASKLGGAILDITEHKSLQQQLLESKKSLEELNLQQNTILENAFVGIAFLQDRNFVWVNEKLEEIFGYEKGEVIGLKTDIIYPDEESYKDLGKEAYPLLAAGKTYYKERLMKRKDGTLFWCELSGKAIRDENVIITGSIWVVQDISERKKWEKALVESESRLARASKIAHVGHWEWIPATGSMYWADEIYNIFGFEPGEFEPNLKLTMEQLHPEDRVQVMEVLTFSIENASPIHVEFRFYRKDGTMAYGEVMADMEVDSSGKVVKISGVFVDITHHRKYQEALRENEARLQALLENISNTIMIMDKNGTIKFVSKSVEKISGFTPEEVISSGFSTIHPDDITATNAAILKSIQNPRTPIPLEMRIKNKKGEYLTYSTFGINHLDNPLIEGIVISLHDVTERKQLEENLKQANKAKSEFLANMSHEIRTPMNAIIGFTEILNKKISGEQEKKYLQSIMSSSKTLLRLINDILDLSKVEAGKMVMEYEHFDLRHAMEDIRSMFSAKASEKNINFELNLDKNIPPAIYLDEVRFRQVLINLVSNSVKFTDSGKVSVSCFIHKNNRKNKTMDLEISVKDTGIGISASDLDHIFEAFSQHSGNIAKYGGTGLGLSITKNLTTMMNGSIQVNSEPGKGSEFRIIFNEVGYQNKKTDSLEAGSEEDIEFEKALILVVDDVVSNRDLIRGFFEDSSLDFIEAADGKEALENAEKFRPDLIVMDLRMPVMDGYEATMILKNNPGLKHIPIVVASASGMEQKANEMKHLIQGYLRKPVAKRELVAIFKTHLKFKSMKKKEIISQEDDQISLEQAAEILKVLNQKTLQECERVSSELDFEKISEFLEKISRKTKHLSVKVLERWIMEMQSAVRLFDVDEIRKLSMKLSQIAQNIAKKK